MSTINAILTERGTRYGDFAGHALVTQELKMVLSRHARSRGKDLTAAQQESLDMICHKLGRIVNGDPNYADSWVDIAGYARLVADILNEKAQDIASCEQQQRTKIPIKDSKFPNTDIPFMGLNSKA